MKSFYVFQITILLLTAIAGTAVVLTREPKKQVFVAGVYGIFQVILYFSLHSPDVALSELAVGTLAVPFLLLFTLAKLERMK